MTSKKLLSALMALVFALGMFTALPVSADGVTATVGGVAVADGGQICATSTVVFTVPADVTDLDMVTFYEKSKTPTSGTTDYPWFKRNFDGSLEGQTLTVIFERGDISPNSTYKFEFDANADAEGAEYSFNFVTIPEVDANGAKVYFADNFSRYTWTTDADRNFQYANWGTNSLPYNLDPLRKTRTWIGTSSVYSGIKVNSSGTQFFSIFSNNAKYGQFGINPQYSATVNSLNHTGKTKIQFVTNSLSNIIDFAGLAITQAQDAESGVVTWSVYGENTAKNPTGDTTFDAAAHTLLGTKTFASSTVALGVLHTVEYVTDTTLTTANVATRKLIQVKVNGDVVWQQGSGTPATFTFPASSAKGVPFASTQTTSVPTVTNMFNSANTQLDVYYAEYTDYIAEPLIVENTANNYNTNNTITFSFDQNVTLTSVIDNVVLERQDIADENWYVMDAKSFMSLRDSKTLVATFADGDLTAGMNYRMKISAGAKSALGGALVADSSYVTFTAKAQNHYYMNDNFEQYKENWGWQGDALVQANPWRFHAGWTGAANETTGKTQSNAGIRVDANGNKYLCVQPSTMQSYVFKQTYAQSLPEGETGIRGLTTVELSFKGNGLLYEINGVGIQPLSDGSWNVYYRCDGDGNAVDLSYGSRVAGDHCFTKIGSYAVGDTALDGSEKHTVILDTEVHYEYIGGTYRPIRTIHGIKVDGVAILANEIGNGLVCDYPGYFADGIFFNDEYTKTKNANNAFFATSVGGAGNGEIRIHAISYCDAIAVDAAQSGTTLTFTVKNDTAVATSAIPVLAIYDGAKLVRVDGLAADATAIAVGATATFAKTVTADEAGYSYKFMLLDSAAGLQPLWYATKGTIQ